MNSKETTTRIPDDYDLYSDPDYINLTFERSILNPETGCYEIVEAEDVVGKHMRSIRYQLWLGRKAYKQRMGSSAWGIEKTLQALQGVNVCIERQAFIKLYDPTYKTRNINLTAVLRLCEIWDLDPEKVLAFPSEHKLRKPETSDDGLEIFADERYGGKYYCYFFQITGNDSHKDHKKYTLRKKESLIKATLDIQITGPQRVTAIFTYDNITSSGIAKRKYASCTPTISKLGNVYFDFTDNDGRVYKISFNYQDFPTPSKCYFRIASMLTESSGKTSFPLFQKMALFRNEPDPSYDDYIRGLLNPANENLLIRPEMLEELSDDPLIKKFKENFCSVGDMQTSAPLFSVYHLKESTIPYENSNMSLYEVQKALMKLAHYSFSHGQLLVGNNDNIHRIAKDMQDYREPKETNEI